MVQVALGVARRAVDRAGARHVRERLDRVLVVWARALRHECRRAVALEVRDGCERRVHGQLLVVCAEAVAVCVRVREEARLRDGVCGRLDIWDEVRGRDDGLRVASAGLRGGRRREEGG